MLVRSSRSQICVSIVPLRSKYQFLKGSISYMGARDFEHIRGPI